MKLYWWQACKILFSQDEPQMSWLVFTNNWLLVMTGYIVPLDSIAIKVIEYRHARLFLSPLLYLFSVIWLSLSSSSSMGPVIELSAIGWSHFNLISWPEPTVDIFWEKFRFVTSVKVAFSARSPKIRDPTIHKSFDPLVLSLALKTHQVHASFSAVISCIKPVPFSVPHSGVGILPTEPVISSLKLMDSSHLGSDSTELWVTKTQFSLVLFISTTICWKQRISSFWSKGLNCAWSKENWSDSAGDRSEKVHDGSEEIIEDSKLSCSGQGTQQHHWKGE